MCEQGRKIFRQTRPYGPNGHGGRVYELAGNARRKRLVFTWIFFTPMGAEPGVLGGSALAHRCGGFPRSTAEVTHRWPVAGWLVCVLSLDLPEAVRPRVCVKSFCPTVLSWLNLLLELTFPPAKINMERLNALTSFLVTWRESLALLTDGRVQGSTALVSEKTGSLILLLMRLS